MVALYHVALARLVQRYEPLFVVPAVVLFYDERPVRAAHDWNVRRQRGGDELPALLEKFFCFVERREGVALDERYL